jgi:bacterioferritin-associated ferredoxin
MYVCICHAVTDRDIRACIEDGANSMRELRKQLCVGTQCGKCACHVRDLLKEAKSESGSALSEAGCAA